MGKIGRRGPHKARKKRIADARERSRIALVAKRERLRQSRAEREKKLSPAERWQLREYDRHALFYGLALATSALKRRG